MYHMRNGLTSSRGTRIVIEDGPELPNLLSDGISIASGTETMIALKTHVIKRLKKPYGSHCENNITDIDVRKMYPLEFKYSAKSCNSFCYVVNTNRECKCYRPEEVGGVMLSQYDTLSKKFDRCDTEVELECSRGVPGTYKTCNCHPECHDIIYKVIALTRVFQELCYLISLSSYPENL